ncbi:MAG: 4-hydroxy-tetrahydrodipicolinate reductase [Microbacteriaceae bacterium]
MTIQVAVVGASGKMGQLFVRLITESSEYSVHSQLGSRDDLAGVLGADLVVDVTAPSVSPRVVAFAVEHGINVLVGTSGWSAERIATLSHQLGKEPTAGVLIIPNFSVGSLLATSFSAMAARFFDSAEIVEAHQASKIDSPSGTAVRTAELMAKARADMGPVSAPHNDQRARGQQVASIQIHSLRLSGLIASQDVIFGGTGETLTIRHETLSTDSYEKGIMLSLAAAPDVTGVTVGLESLIDLGKA